jgi:O-antigen/teichoic acid export membrane protein
MKTPLLRNAAAGAAQTVGLGALFLFLYRTTNVLLGVERLGIWSVVLATASAVRLADVGMSVSVTRFVARALGAGKPAHAAAVLETAMLTVAAVVGAALFPAYLLLGWLLGHLLPSSPYLAEARAILPFGLVSLWLASIAAIVQGGLDGCQRIDVRGALVVTAQGLMVGVSVALMPSLGLMGLVWGQIAQGIVLAAGGWLAVRRFVPALSPVPRRWRRSVLREIAGYGANIQGAAVLNLLFDPFTRALMARFGGPGAAGYFEMASQVVLRLRAFIVAANQAAVPWIAHVAETSRERLSVMYGVNMRVLVVLTLPLYALIFAWAGFLSQVLLDRHDDTFVFLLRLISLAWLLNTVNVPAYFMNIGLGDVGDNTVSHLAMGVLNVALGTVLGRLSGAPGVAWAYVVALIAGSWLLLALFRRRHAMAWESILSVEHVPLATVCSLALLVGWLDPWTAGGRDILRLAFIVVLIPLAMILAMWRHPARKVIWARLFVREPSPS